MKKYNDSRQGRPASYPRPTETDEQLQHQPEYIDQQPNDFRDKSISDIPAREEGKQGEPGGDQQAGA
ncbi:MAG: hypothetical protein ACXVMS_16500 [Flavisolibacter sp.]